MNDANRFFSSTLSLLILTLLSAMSPMLSVMVADMMRPYLEIVSRRALSVRCHISKGLRFLPMLAQATQTQNF